MCWGHLGTKNQEHAQYFQRLVDLVSRRQIRNFCTAQKLSRFSRAKIQGPMKEKEEKEVHIKVATIDSVWTPFLIAMESPGSDCINFSTMEQGSGGDPSQGFGLEPSFRHSGSKPVKNSNILELKALKSSQYVSGEVPLHRSCGSGCAGQ